MTDMEFGGTPYLTRPPWFGADSLVDEEVPNCRLARADEVLVVHGPARILMASQRRCHYVCPKSRPALPAPCFRRRCRWC